METLTLKEWAENATSSSGSTHYLVRKVLLVFKTIHEDEKHTSDEWMEIANKVGVHPNWPGYNR